MSTPRQPLYQRLPEIYRIKDIEQTPPGQLEAYLAVAEEVYAAIRDNIEALYHDLFIETCDDWVIPYIADLLGTSHLSGDPWTLRADVARTVHHRRRKGTLSAVESLSFSLTGWAAHTVELRDRLVWNQHLNHLRPDAGGRPPLRLRENIGEAVRGGTVTLRDPAMLSFLDGPFDPFAHVVDLKPIGVGLPRYNLPNLAVFLWRLQAYQVPVSQPGLVETQALAPADPGEAAWSVRTVLHSLAEPLVLFNTHRFHADAQPPELTRPDAVPGPMPMARLSEDTLTGRPEAYVAVETYTGSAPLAPAADSVGLNLHLPGTAFAGRNWRIRGANLCAWEEGLFPPLREYEIIVDSEHGRVVVGVTDESNEADVLVTQLRVSATHGFAGPTGAWPIARAVTPAVWLEQAPVVRTVNYHGNPDSLRDALADLPDLTAPLIVEIEDSMTHRLDLTAVNGIGDEGGEPALRLGHSLWIPERSASGHRAETTLTAAAGRRHRPRCTGAHGRARVPPRRAVYHVGPSGLRRRCRPDPPGGAASAGARRLYLGSRRQHRVGRQCGRNPPAPVSRSTAHGGLRVCGPGRGSRLRPDSRAGAAAQHLRGRRGRRGLPADCSGFHYRRRQRRRGHGDGAGYSRRQRRSRGGVGATAHGQWHDLFRPYPRRQRYR